MSAPPKKPSAQAVGLYGAVLAYVSDEVMEAWCGSSRVRQVALRAYCRLFGYPELAAHRRSSLVRQALSIRGGLQVVDVGARNGLYILADALRHPERRYAAVDISRAHLRRVRLAAQHFGVRVLPLASRAEALALPSESADLVLTIEVLQFVEDDRLATSEIGRILRPGGVWWCEQELHSVGRPTRPGEQSTLVKRRLGHSVTRLSDLAHSAGMTLRDTRLVDGAIGRWWEGLEARIHHWSVGLHLIAFPVLRALSSLTANRWTDLSPSTLLYRFEKRPGT